MEQRQTGTQVDCACCEGIICCPRDGCEQKPCTITCRCPPCCTHLDFLVNREIRSLLCLFSCHHSCHPGRLCGPAPCYESQMERYKRWTKEAVADMDARTERFYQSYDPEHYVFGRSKTRYRDTGNARRDHQLRVFKLIVKQRADGRDAGLGIEMSEVSEASTVAPAGIAVAVPKPVEMERHE